MHMHFLFIKSKAADPPSLIESSPWRLLSGAQVSSKKQHVHMNATNGHMFEGVDPRPVPPPHPPWCDRRASNHFGEIMGPKKKRYEIIFKKRFRNIKAVVFCMCWFFFLFFFFVVFPPDPGSPVIHLQHHRSQEVTETSTPPAWRRTGWTQQHREGGGSNTAAR